jgi:hypothetical protein
VAKNHKDPKELLPGDIQAMLLSAAELEGRVKTLQATMKSLDIDYTALFGATLTLITFNWRPFGCAAKKFHQVL